MISLVIGCACNPSPPSHSGSTSDPGGTLPTPSGDTGGAVPTTPTSECLDPATTPAPPECTAAPVRGIGLCANALDGVGDQIHGRFTRFDDRDVRFELDDGTEV